MFDFRIYYLDVSFAKKLGGCYFKKVNKKLIKTRSNLN